MSKTPLSLAFSILLLAAACASPSTESTGDGDGRLARISTSLPIHPDHYNRITPTGEPGWLLVMEAGEDGKQVISVTWAEFDSEDVYDTRVVDGSLVGNDSQGCVVTVSNLDEGSRYEVLATRACPSGSALKNREIGFTSEPVDTASTFVFSGDGLPGGKITLDETTFLFTPGSLVDASGKANHKLYWDWVRADRLTAHGCDATIVLHRSPFAGEPGTAELWVSPAGNEWLRGHGYL